MTVAVCIKWVDSRAEVDPLTGVVRSDERTAGASPADEAALEWALRTEEPVVALTAGPPGASSVLRMALAAGAASAVLVDLDPATPSDVVALALASALPADVDLVICGVWSLDRGSGSVPAFLAAGLDATQALGLLSVAFAPGGITAERRLDRGRRERLRVPRPAVLSVEGGSARLRRAPLSGVLAAGQAKIDVVAGPAVHLPPVRRYPFRPRPRVVPALSSSDPRSRILELTGALTDRTPPQRLTLDPDAAADCILAQLHEWGFR